MVLNETINTMVMLNHQQHQGVGSKSIAPPWCWIEIISTTVVLDFENKKYSTEIYIPAPQWLFFVFFSI